MKSCQHGRTETSCPDCARIHLGIGIMPVTTHDIPDVLRNKENLVAELRTELAAAIRATAIARKEIEQLQAKVAEAKREALKEAADRLERIAGEEGFYSNHVQTHDDDVKELRRIAAGMKICDKLTPTERY